MDIPYQIIAWSLRQGLSTHLRSPRHDLHNGYLIAELLSKLYPTYLSIDQFDNQSSTATTSRNWKRIAAVAPKINLALSKAELEACKAGNEQVLITIFKRIYALNTGREVVENSESSHPVSNEVVDRSSHKAHPSKQAISLNNNQPNQAVNQDPLKFLVTRNLDNLQPVSFQDSMHYVTGANLSTIMAPGDADGLMGASTRRNLSILSARPSTAAADDYLGLSTTIGGTSSGNGPTSEGKSLPRNVPRFVRGAYISTRKLLMELSTACKTAIMSLPELQSMLEMIDPRIDTLYPFVNICLRVPADNASALFDALILELKPFTNLFVEQISANPFLFWELLKLLVLSSTNLHGVTGPKTDFPRRATDYLLHLIAELGRVSPSSLALIFNHIIKTRLMHVIDLRVFGLYNFIDLCMAFLPIMEHDSALDIITTILKLVDANFKERSSGRYMINSGKLRLAVLTAIVSVISNYFIKFGHDPKFMMYGMFVSPGLAKSDIGDIDMGSVSNRDNNQARFADRETIHMSGGSTRSGSEPSISTGYGIVLQKDDGTEPLSGRELLEQMLLDMLYVIIRLVSGSETRLLEERIVVLDLLSRCCAANPQELMPYAEPTIFAVFESIVNRAKPYVVIVPARDGVEGTREPSRQGSRVDGGHHAQVIPKITPLNICGSLQTIPEEDIRKESVSSKQSSKTPRKMRQNPPAVPETHTITDSVHSSDYTASPISSINTSQVNAPPTDRHSPIATMSALASERHNSDQSPDITNNDDDIDSDEDGYNLNCQYDNLPYLHYETLLALVLILRKLASLCIKDHYDTPLILISYDFEKVIMELHDQLPLVSLLIGILSTVGRNIEMIKHITQFTIQSILDDNEKVEAYADTIYILKYIIYIFVQYPDMTEVVFAALDGKGDFEQSMVIFPAHCYLKIVQALYPGSELMDIVPALLCTAIVYSKEFLGHDKTNPNNYFIAVARLIEFIPDISKFVFDHLGDELFAQITDPQVSETAGSLLTDLLIELDGILDEQDLQASIHALIQYAFNSNEVLLPYSRSAFTGKVLEDCQLAVITFLNSLTMVPSVLSLIRDLLIKTDSEDYGNAHLSKFIRSVLDESTGGDD